VIEYKALLNLQVCKMVKPKKLETKSQEVFTSPFRKLEDLDKAMVTFKLEQLLVKWEY